MVSARQTAHGRVITETLPIGTLLKLLHEPRQTGMIEVLWDGQLVRVFAHDLIAHAEPISAKGR